MVRKKKTPHALAKAALAGRRLKVAVVMGGDSPEREVSLHSGEAVAQGLRDAGCEVTEVVLQSEDLSALNGYDGDAVFIALHGASYIRAPGPQPASAL